MCVLFVVITDGRCEIDHLGVCTPSWIWSDSSVATPRVPTLTPASLLVTNLISSDSFHIISTSSSKGNRMQPKGRRLGADQRVWATVGISGWIQLEQKRAFVFWWCMRRWTTSRGLCEMPPLVCRGFLFLMSPMPLLNQRWTHGVVRKQIISLHLCAGCVTSSEMTVNMRKDWTDSRSDSWVNPFNASWPLGPFVSLNSSSSCTFSSF